MNYSDQAVQSHSWIFTPLSYLAFLVGVPVLAGVLDYFLLIALVAAN